MARRSRWSRRPTSGAIWPEASAATRWQVTSIITSPDADPHEYEANTRNQLALADAAVVLENGGGYDDFMDRMLKSAKNTSATVLNAVDHLRQEGSRR